MSPRKLEWLEGFLELFRNDPSLCTPYALACIQDARKHWVCRKRTKLLPLLLVQRWGRLLASSRAWSSQDPSLRHSPTRGLCELQRNLKLAETSRWRMWRGQFWNFWPNEVRTSSSTLYWSTLERVERVIDRFRKLYSPTILLQWPSHPMVILTLVSICMHKARGTYSSSITSIISATLRGSVKHTSWKCRSSSKPLIMWYS